MKGGHLYMVMLAGWRQRILRPLSVMVPRRNGQGPSVIWQRKPACLLRRRATPCADWAGRSVHCITSPKWWLTHTGSRFEGLDHRWLLCLLA